MGGGADNGVSDTVDYGKVHYISMHKMGIARDFSGPKSGPPHKGSPMHNTKCTPLSFTYAL